MARVWYCATCGYEVHSKGRCHNCGNKFTASALRELEALGEDEEVGYRLDGWAESDRGRLIVALNDFGIAHRFEEEELVVAAGDEDRVDDVVNSLADGISLGAGHDSDASDADEGDDDIEEAPSRTRPRVEPLELHDDVPQVVRESVTLLASAAARLRADPTDMQADGDVAEASASVFLLDSYDPLGEEEWSAVGRVTRRLLSLLGADEALEEGIRGQAAILEKLLAPVASGSADGSAGGSADGSAGGKGTGTATSVGVRTVYELPEWLPEQRAELGVLLDAASIPYSWEGDELLVPSEREDEVEGLFERIEGVSDEEDDGADEKRYEAVAELFAAAGRLASDPSDEERQAAVVDWFAQADGPPLLGMDDTDWYRIVNRGKTLLALIEEDDPDTGHIRSEANELHRLLRSVV